MKTRELPLGIWLVIESVAGNKLNVLSTHPSQDDAEAERDRRNGQSPRQRCNACIALQPIAERMGRAPG